MNGKMNSMTFNTARRAMTRNRLLVAAAGASAALLVAEARPGATNAADSPAPCSSSDIQVLDTLLAAEQVAACFYYAGLTTRAVVGHPYLAGTSANPNAVSSNGSPVNVACFQAALDQERKHAALLRARGAKSSHARAYFPKHTLQSLGYTSQPGTFLWVLDHLETLMIGAYLAAISTFAGRKNLDMVLLCSRIFGPECQHRAIWRSR
jgi:hypothetical protein